MQKSIFTEEYALLVKILTDARKDEGKTQEEVAQALGVPQSFVSKYENRERRLDVIEFVRIARILGVDPCELIKELCDVASQIKKEAR